jgi:cytochrome c-type biogenesis protein CcmH/NrfG
MEQATRPQEETLAEAVGLTAELGEAIADLAEKELAAGRSDAARTILEGLVVTNPRDARGWILLARVHRGLGQPLAARFCAEVAGILAPASPEALLARAEGLLLFEEDRDQGLELLARLAQGEGAVADRAAALWTASGAGLTPKG